MANTVQIFFFPLKVLTLVHYGGLDSFKQQKQTIMYAFDALHKLISFFLMSSPLFLFRAIIPEANHCNSTGR